MSSEPNLSAISQSRDPEQRIPPDRPVPVVGPLASILIPCCGMIEYTKLCVPSILKHTRPPFELIFIDIGSLDGTAEYLAGVATAHLGIRVEILRTATDLGIRDLCLDAVARARGEYLVLLNNDTVVTRGWLQQMMALANMSSVVGMVGPMSNYAASPQLIETIPYRVGAGRDRSQSVDISAIDSFAQKLREEHKGKWIETDRLGGFCLLLKREVLTRIGPLGPWADLSLFDTDILAAKARQAGFTLAVCRDLFIHHFGTRTFAHGAPQPKNPDQLAPKIGSSR